MVKFLQRFNTGPFNVAEKRRVCRSGWVLEAIKFTGSINPISNILSASSMTRTWIWLRSTFFFSIRSIKRPGVATRISWGLETFFTCSVHPAPPKTTTDRIWFIPLENRMTSFSIWAASSLVGDKMRTLGPVVSSLFSRSIWIVGKRNAAVLPVPVSAQAKISFPSSM